ncbi:gamma-glutamylcyclotransferase family protein [Flavobacterium chungbukense]|uniref:Gamma-glutamylcyclotransferase n=1 Tax=Flavobacterium chungbukense TaxID=877464 RepID=A0ABP7YWB8_9FLAO|nr:gamma-glutamylcyclotransferase family protein [Flavobacterium chungbukense]MCC4924014.1 gamma-glutamylcyclotransferase [Flavobacterium chungbukense]
MKDLQLIPALIIYGSLAPGESNHSVMNPIKGEWKKAIIKGKLQEGGWGSSLGYNGFVSVNLEEAETIKCYVLFSEDLTTNWDYLDEFEGDGYVRIQTEYQLQSGEIGIGYIYALKQ